MLTSLIMVFAIATQPSMAALPTKSAIKDSRIILRNALPIDNDVLRDVQRTLEQMPRQANLKRWSSLKKDIETISRTLTQNKTDLIVAASSDRKQSVTDHLSSLEKALVPLQEAIEIKDRNNVKALSEKSLDYVGLVESDLIKEFPFTVPVQYAGLPQLKGRAFVELVTEKGNAIITVDGYNAPVNAGQFVDLVQKHFYDGLTFHRVEPGFVIQGGDPLGNGTGGSGDPIKLEIWAEGDTEATIGNILTGGKKPVIKHNKAGVFSMARTNDPNSATSQFFITLGDASFLDGQYAAFGYTEDTEVAQAIRRGDKILSIKVEE
jgi:cyclophilin family peptidyl-prolyl cis-trans isomerase